jgi:hypothetical protein
MSQNNLSLKLTSVEKLVQRLVAAEKTNQKESEVLAIVHQVIAKA